MKAQISIMREVEKASSREAKRARTWVRFSFSSLRFRAAAASVCWCWPKGSQARRSSIITVTVRGCCCSRGNSYNLMSCRLFWLLHALLSLLLRPCLAHEIFRGFVDCEEHESDK